jgi:hypothetical protein
MKMKTPVRGPDIHLGGKASEGQLRRHAEARTAAAAALERERLATLDAKHAEFWRAAGFAP